MNEFVPQISFLPFHIFLEKDQIAHPAKDLRTFTLKIGEYANVLENLQQINFFIGENNSGKSRFIRAVAKWSKVAIFPRYEEVTNFSNFSFNRAEDYLQAVLRDLSGDKDETFNEIYVSIRHINSKYDFMHNLEVLDKLEKKLLKQREIFSLTLENVGRQRFFEMAAERLYRNMNSQSTEYINSFIENYEKLYNREINSRTQLRNYLNKVVISQPILYIPLLRGAKLLGGDVYLDRIEKDYKLPKKDIFTGLSIYDDLKTHLLGSYEQRELIKGFETLLSEHFFDNQTVTLIPKINADYVIVRIGNVEHPLHDLGDGIQALIVLLFPLYMHKNEDYYIFIEEPEMHLYPKWQRLFIKIIKKEFPKHQFFITTHSNVFINTANTSIYQVTRSSDKSEVKHIIGNDKRGILADLGYQPSDILHANFIIWVEGISDKIYIKKFLELYDENLKEGEDYTIMFYGGCGQIEHFLPSNDVGHEINLASINPRFAFLVDSDRTKEKLQGAGHQIKERIKEEYVEFQPFYWMTYKRMVENYIPEDVWKQAAQIYCDKIGKDIAGVKYPTDWDYGDRFKPDGVEHLINDKVQIAHCIVPLLNKEHLEAQRDLKKNLPKLVDAIRAANS